MSLFKYFFVLAPFVFLTGCVDREMADNKLIEGCKGAASYFVQEGYEIKEVRDVSAQTVTLHHDQDMRKIAMVVSQSDGWDETEKNLECIFAESFGLLGITHKADIFRVSSGDDALGKDENGNIQGSLQEWMALTERVNDSM